MELQEELDLQELCRRADVTVRTVRYYVQQGLLPAPGQGAKTRYGLGHLNRLRLVKQLQRQHLPLAEIRHRLERLDNASVARLLEELREPDGDGMTSKWELEEPGHGGISKLAWMASPSPTPAAATWRDAERPEGVAREPGRSQWERMTLTGDVELHVRRPLSREDVRRVERLLEAARGIFGAAS